MYYYTKEAAETHIEIHTIHISSGFCSSVSSKSWCNLKANHLGLHEAKHKEEIPDNKTGHTQQWSKGEGCPCFE